MFSRALASGAQLLGASAHRGPIAHTDDIDAFARSLQQSGQDAARSEFNEEVATTRQQPLHAIGPSDRARDLILQGLTNFRQRFNDAAGVNIDQEMANLLNLQNSYAANARVLSAVKDMIDTLLQMGT